MTTPARLNPRHQPGPRPPASGPHHAAPTPITAPRIEQGDLLRVREVAALLNVGRDVIYRLIDAGAFGQPVHVGRVVQVRREALDQFVARGGTQG